jgi:DNA-binding NtrC family response regulator
MSVRVLVVDDEVSNHELVAEYLRGRGWVVGIARDGRQARALLGGLRYDLLITDLKLPDCDGLDLIRSAGRRLPPVPGIVMTGYANVEVVVRALRLRAYDFVQKPFRLRDLYDVAQAALLRAAQDRESTASAAALSFYESAALAEDREAALALTSMLVDCVAALEGVRYVAISREGASLVQLGNRDEAVVEYALPGDHVMAVSPAHIRVPPMVAAAENALRRCGL